MTSGGGSRSEKIRLASLVRERGGGARPRTENAPHRAGAPKPLTEKADWSPSTPIMADPYPPRFRRVRYLRQETDLMIARPRARLRPQHDREEEYVVLRDFTVAFEVDGREWRVTAPAGMLTDLATSRWFTKPVLGRVGPHLEAAIIHDYLSIAWQDVTARRDRRRPRRGDFEFSNAAMMAMLARVNLHPVVTWGVRKVITSDTGRKRFIDPNPAPRYVKVPRGGDYPD